ncbi:MAG: ASKHA domain-containing protein, partial [Dehalococcoidales bacterium]|nr:ASKHA domain-containing protein [Dehalococcoidales bacterium]
ERSMLLGMFPDCELQNVYAVGNAAGDGARIALLNASKRAEADRIARQVEYVELTTEKGFQSEFMYAMHFPHMRDPFPNVEEWLAREGCAPAVLAGMPKAAKEES